MRKASYEKTPSAVDGTFFLPRKSVQIEVYASAVLIFLSPLLLLLSVVPWITITARIGYEDVPCLCRLRYSTGIVTFTASSATNSPDTRGFQCPLRAIMRNVHSKKNVPPPVKCGRDIKTPILMPDQNKGRKRFMVGPEKQE